jgi:outer membrane protein W
MRYAKVVLALTLIAVLAVPSFAQRTPGSYSIGGFAGIGMLQKPTFIKDSWKNSIGFGGELKYNVSEMTSLAASFTYIPFKLNTDKIKQEFGAEAANVSISGGELKTSVISVNLLKYFTAPEASAGVYFTVGGGYYMFKFGDLTVEGQKIPMTGMGTESKFGINGGLGLEIKAGEKLALFAEGKYHYVFTKEEANATADEKGKLQFITIMGGLRLSI